MREPRKRQQAAAAARNNVAPVERSTNLMEMPLDEFQGALAELAQQGVKTDALLRQYRAANSPFAAVNRAAEASSAELAAAGRRPVAGTAGLLSRPIDDAGGVRFEPAAGLLGMLAGVGRQIDAPMAAYQELIPAEDMDLEALGTAGVATLGGGAVTRPAGSFGANSLRVYHGGAGDVTGAAGGRGAWFSEAKDLADEYAFGGGSVDQFSITPQRPISFVHAEQRRPVGDIISTAVENAGDLSDEAIAAARGKISTLQERYGNESRPLFEYWNNDPDIADLFRTLGYDSISVAEKSGGPQTWAALTPDIIAANAAPEAGLLSAAAARTPAEQMARQILDMRAAGRAGDVTDEMMAAADPQYMFANTPLPMDEASRMVRAGEMGFDTKAFHGGRGGYDALDPEMATGKTYGTGVWATDAPDVAATYTGSIYDDTQAVYPLRLNESNYGKADWANRPWGDGYQFTRLYNPRGSGRPTTQKFSDIYEDWQGWASTDNAARAAGEQGLEGLRINRVVDIGPNIYSRADVQRPLPETATSFAIQNPATARSRFARFDPEFAHLSNLSAANIDPLTGLFGAMAAEDQRRRRNAP